jgi:hypothetical protein
MIVRIGKTLYWVGVAGSAVFIFGFFMNGYDAWTSTSFGREDRLELMPVCLVGAVVTWLIGKGVRYILSNEW